MELAEGEIISKGTGMSGCPNDLPTFAAYTCSQRHLNTAKVPCASATVQKIILEPALTVVVRHRRNRKAVLL